LRAERGCGALGYALPVVLALVSSAAHAENKACASAYHGAQQLERAGRLHEAQGLASKCVKRACGRFYANACTAIFTRLEADLPSVVAVVTDGGEPRTDVAVEMDGVALTPATHGHAVIIDPGLHEFSFKAGGEVLGREKVLVLQGQRNRLVTLSLHPRVEAPAVALPAVVSPPVAAPPPPAPEPLEVEKMETPPPRPPRPSGSAAPYLLGAVGVAGLGGYALLTYWGRKDNDLLAGCTPNCAPATVDHIHKLYLAADVAAGVGVAALLASAWLALRSSPPDDAARARSGPRAYALGVAPARGGGVAEVRGQF
jgi:hypothetical protein